MKGKLARRFLGIPLGLWLAATIVVGAAAGWYAVSNLFHTSLTTGSGIAVTWDPGGPLCEKIAGTGSVTECAKTADGVSFAAEGVSPNSGFVVTRDFVANHGTSNVCLAGYTAPSAAGVVVVADMRIGGTQTYVPLANGYVMAPEGAVFPRFTYSFNDSLPTSTVIPLDFSWTWGPCP